MRPAKGAQAARLSTGQWRQVALISAAALGLYVGLRLIPTGTNLNHMDFRVEGSNTLEMCDPANPQFIPVVAVRSPVLVTLAPSAPPVAGQPVQATLRLATITGKALAPEDLLVTHTRRLHLLIVDATLTDYWHVHPEPGARPGEWVFAFTPRFGGEYRVFADFTPAATGRGLYAHADLVVSGDPRLPTTDAGSPGTRTSVVAPTEDGYRFTLMPAALPIRAGQMADLMFAIERAEGGAVRLEPVMGAYAHLVAFDDRRSGFAHLHPTGLDPSKKPDAQHPRLAFRITIPRAGRYVIWAQVNLDGRERFAPFWFDVAP